MKPPGLHPDYRREIIDTFVNSVYVYDDKLLLTYNYSDGTQALTLKEIEHRKKKRWAASVSDYRCCPLKLCFDPYE